MAEEGGWVPRSRFAKLVSALSVSTLGYNFLQNPQGFVLAVILDWFVDAVTGLAGAVGKVLGDVWGIFADAVIGALGAAIAAPFVALADVVEELLALVSSLATDLAAGAGPFGVLVAIGVWAIASIALFALVAGLWMGYKWVRTVVA